MLIPRLASISLCDFGIQLLRGLLQMHSVPTTPQYQRLCRRQVCLEPRVFHRLVPLCPSPPTDRNSQPPSPRSVQAVHRAVPFTKPRSVMAAAGGCGVAGFCRCPGVAAQPANPAGWCAAPVVASHHQAPSPPFWWLRSWEQQVRMVSRALTRSGRLGRPQLRCLPCRRSGDAQGGRKCGLLLRPDPRAAVREGCCF